MEKTLTKRSQSRCAEPRLTRESLIEEWLPKLAVNAGAALDARTQAVFKSVWLDGLGDLSLEVLLAAFQATLRTCKFWPVKVADIREHVSKAESSATKDAAEIAWERVLELRRVYWNPDIPGPFDRAVARLSERVRQAARAAGVFRDFESVEALHTWAKKRFVEFFTAYGELKQDKFLLPDGEIKNLLTDAAQHKALPAPSVDWAGLRERGETYRKKMATDPSQQPDPKRAIRQLAFKPSLHSLEEQKRILREKGFLPVQQPAEVSAP